MNIFQIENNVDMQTVETNLRVTDEGHNPYRFTRCIDRNIVLIGRSRTGKSTLAKVIEDVFYRPDVETLFSTTHGVEFHKVAASSATGDRLYFNIVDTPGFFEVTEGERTVNSPAHIKRFLDQCMKYDVTNVHMFAFVFSLAGGVNERDIETMRYVKLNYPSLKDYMALVVTHCEALSIQNREHMIAQFWQHRDVRASDLQSFFFTKGVFFTGCLRRESFEQRNETAIYSEYKNILAMRTTFIQQCINCNDTYNVHRNNGSCPIL